MLLLKPLDKWAFWKYCPHTNHFTFFIILLMASINYLHIFCATNYLPWRRALTLWICEQGNLGWAYMQQGNNVAAEVVYRKAQIIDPDANKACNLCLCLIKQARYAEAQSVLDEVLQGKLSGSDEDKSKNRAGELLQELKQCQPVVLPSNNSLSLNIEDAFLEGLDQLVKHWTPLRSRRLPIFEEISPFRDQLACWLLLNAGINCIIAIIVTWINGCLTRVIKDKCIMLQTSGMRHDEIGFLFFVFLCQREWWDC